MSPESGKAPAAHEDLSKTNSHHGTDVESDSIADEPRFEFVDGASFILDRPDGIPAIWGRDNEVLWAKGEALMIAGPQGLGKTTLAGQLLRAMIGVGEREVLGLPVQSGGRVLYLAMDRPMQIARAHGRSFTTDDRDRLAERLIVHRGPPPYDLAKNTDVLRDMALAAGAHAVVVDSVKDGAIGLSDDETGSGYNRARQKALAAGVQVLELHHTIKKGANGAAVENITDIYGSTWLTSGCGSVILLTGSPGDPIINMRHVKQPADEIGPCRLTHDHAAGRLDVYHSVDIYELVQRSGAFGLTAKDAAGAMFDTDKPSRNEVEKARRRLSKLEADGNLVSREKATGGGGKPTTAWYLAMRAAG